MNRLVASYAEPFPTYGPPGPLGRELLDRMIAHESNTGDKACVEDLFGGFRPLWALAALRRITEAGWVRRARVGSTRFTVTAMGYAVHNGITEESKSA